MNKHNEKQITVLDLSAGTLPLRPPVCGLSLLKTSKYQRNADDSSAPSCTCAQVQSGTEEEAGRELHFQQAAQQQSMPRPYFP